MSNRSFVSLLVAWVVLALGTLGLVVSTDGALESALVAWTGGLVTFPLAAEARRRYPPAANSD